MLYSINGPFNRDSLVIERQSLYLIVNDTNRDSKSGKTLRLVEYDSVHPPEWTWSGCTEGSAPPQQ